MFTPFVLVIGDDKGKVMTRAYGEIGAFAQPLTPCQSFLAEVGRRLEQFYVKPWCSPTRFAAFSGRDPNRTGAGSLLGEAEPNPTLDELLLPRLLSAHGAGAIRSGLFGKFHLGFAPSSGGAAAPNVRGWHKFAGNLHNAGTYWDWQRIENGASSTEPIYHTTRIVDDALRWYTTVRTTHTTFLTLAFQAPHEPLHEPPLDLFLTPIADPAHPYERYRAMTEAMDHELFRLLARMRFLSGAYPDDIQRGSAFQTMNVLYFDDNGTAPRSLPSGAVDKHGLPLDPSHSKRTPYQLAVNTACIAAGRDVVSAPPSHRLVSCEDVWATVAELMGVDIACTVKGHPLVFDSVSFADELSGAPVREREHVVTQTFEPNVPNPGTAVGDYAIVGPRLDGHQFKLVQRRSGSEELYDVYEGEPGDYVDPQEAHDLLDGALGELEAEWYAWLVDRLAKHFASME